MGAGAAVEGKVCSRKNSIPVAILRVPVPVPAVGWPLNC